MPILKTEYNSSCSHHYHHLHHLQRLTSSSFGSHLGTEAGAQMLSEWNQAVGSLSIQVSAFPNPYASPYLSAPSRYISSHIGPTIFISTVFKQNASMDTKDLCCCLVAKLCPTLATPWTVTHQAPLFMGFSRQEYWSVLPFPSPGDIPDPGIKAMSPALAGGFFTPEPSGKPT